jgi:hypothetical protein
VHSKRSILSLAGHLFLVGDALAQDAHGPGNSSPSSTAAAARAVRAATQPIKTFTIAFPIPTSAAPEMSPAQIAS